MSVSKEMYDYTVNLCQGAGRDEAFLKEFLRRIEEEPELYKEYEYFMNNNDFLCELKVKTMTVVDILIWNIDRFKAALDEGKFSLKYNRDDMVLMAYYTMYDVMHDPEGYFEHFRQETGTDYEGKNSCFKKIPK